MFQMSWNVLKKGLALFFPAPKNQTIKYNKNMQFSFELTKKDSKTYARRGVIKTLHGEIQTPSFAVVGTKASVKGLTPEDLKSLDTQVVLANAYHLFLRPGTNVIDKFGSFANYMNWDGPTITDSGGYQVSFMWSKEGKSLSKISDEGVTFRSHIDGSKRFISAEISMQIQRSLGADIIMAFDQPISPRFTEKKNKEAFERTLKWEERSFTEWQKGLKEKPHQALFGIIQGLNDKTLRRKCLKFILETGFPGIAIGDETIGSDPAVTAKSLDTVSDMLPSDKPLHALGLGGGPEGIFEAVERGVDIFDNSSVTRMARTGILYIYPEDGGTKANKFRDTVKKIKFESEKKPFSKTCKCYACQNYSASYIRHLVINEEPLGVRLTTIHNVHFVNTLMEEIRNSIEKNDFTDLKKYWLRK